MISHSVSQLDARMGGSYRGTMNTRAASITSLDMRVTARSRMIRDGNESAARRCSCPTF
jgi:hypothetical protein